MASRVWRQHIGDRVDGFGAPHWRPIFVKGCEGPRFVVRRAGGDLVRIFIDGPRPGCLVSALLGEGSVRKRDSLWRLASNMGGFGVGPMGEREGREEREEG
ncbi:hypothetical protein TIFTF001_005716 [Ficus carica]|uniref:Uncharacterized protein n=1 Tax=Ficus carica TaxID=3494 RepID=A0AA87ZYV5_FICCA|nr:hypothetical protein TIFTF001_005716 [Ficus carica]